MASSSSTPELGVQGLLIILKRLMRTLGVSEAEIEMDMERYRQLPRVELEATLDSLQRFVTPVRTLQPGEGPSNLPSQSNPQPPSAQSGRQERRRDSTISARSSPWSLFCLLKT